MVDSLYLKCVEDAADSLTFEAVDAADATVRVQVQDNTGQGVMYYDRDKARELFNWLGVWLHTP